MKYKKRIPADMPLIPDAVLSLRSAFIIHHF